MLTSTQSSSSDAMVLTGPTVSLGDVVPTSSLADGKAESSSCRGTRHAGSPVKCMTPGSDGMTLGRAAPLVNDLGVAPSQSFGPSPVDRVTPGRDGMTLGRAASLVDDDLRVARRLSIV